jgi:hypothetical protein
MHGRISEFDQSQKLNLQNCTMDQMYYGFSKLRI